MKNRRIFSKKKSNFFLFFTFIILSVVFIFLINNFYLKKNNKIFLINENSYEFYIVPKDKQGKIIPNTQVKILNENDNQQILNKDTLNYSIQIYASNDYNILINKLNHLTTQNINKKIPNENFFDIDDFSVVVFKHNLGIDYLLVYKNFENYQEAKEYCSNSLTFILNCLVVNVNNLD